MMRDLGGADRRDVDPVLPTPPARPLAKAPALPRRVLPAKRGKVKLATDEVVSLVDDEAFDQSVLEAEGASIDALDVPLPPGVVNVALALGELGTVSAIAQVARALAGTPLTAGSLGQSLARFAKHLSDGSAQLLALPGFGEALLTLGGIAGVMGGAVGLWKELKALPQGEADAPGLLAIAARVAQLVGGVATALSPLCPALAPVGALLLTSGAAFALGKLAHEQRGALAGAADGVVKLLSNNGGSIMPSPMRIIGDNGAGAPADQGGWVTR